MDRTRTHLRQISGLQSRPEKWFDALARHRVGVAPTPAPALNIRAVSRGEPAPRICLPDLEGKVVDLAAFQAEPILLLFWSPGGVHCEELLPHVLAFELVTNRLPLVVISRGSISVNRDLGFASPVVLDDDRAIAQAFGVTGTPSAVLIGAHGIVASDVVRGAAAVRAFVDTCYIPVTTHNPPPPSLT